MATSLGEGTSELKPACIGLGSLRLLSRKHHCHFGCSSCGRPHVPKWLVDSWSCHKSGDGIEVHAYHDTITAKCKLVRRNSNVVFVFSIALSNTSHVNWICAFSEQYLCACVCVCIYMRFFIPTDDNTKYISNFFTDKI